MTHLCFMFTGMCLEKRAFYRMISGLHTSINIHLCDQYLFPGNSISIFVHKENSYNYLFKVKPR